VINWRTAFINSHVDGLIDIPTLKSLRNLTVTVFTPTFWTGATHQGLSLITLAPGASFSPLTYLDLTGNSLNDESIAFVSQLSAIEEMHLEDNNFAFVPNLTDSFYLRQLSVMLNHTFNIAFNHNLFSKHFTSVRFNRIVGKSH
jgi:hypothetical protein